MAKTVYVIGAGASTEFGGGMPVGTELAEIIENIMDEDIEYHDGPISGAFARNGGCGTNHELAIKRVRQGIVTKESIDDFVDEWQDVPHLAITAKLGITHALLGAENDTYWGRAARGDMSPSSALRQNRGSWLGRVLRFHNGTTARRNFVEAMSDIVFIVFNYDRLIEYHLYHHLLIGLDVPAAEAAQIVNSLPIIHVYGPAGIIPELGGRQGFGSQNLETLFESASMIRTYTEAIESVTRDRIVDLMADASRVVFLGMAYHPQNIDLLFPDLNILDQPNAPFIFGTTYGMRDTRINSVMTTFRNPYHPVRLESLQASALIDKWQDSLFG